MKGNPRCPNGSKIDKYRLFLIESLGQESNPPRNTICCIQSRQNPLIKRGKGNMNSIQTVETGFEPATYEKTGSQDQRVSLTTLLDQ